MKKLLAIALALVMVLGLLAGCGAANNEPTEADTPAIDTLPDATEETEAAEDAGLTTVEEGKLIMSTNAAFPPYEMTDDNGNFIGIDVEIAQAIAEKLGLELVIDNMEFTAALEAAQQGKADMVMAGVTVNEDRLAVMDFSDSYATGIQVVIVPEDSDIATPDDLTGKKIGTQMGTTGYISASDTPENGGYGEENVVAYDNGITAVQALLNKQIDAVIIDNAPAQEFVKANPGLKILEAEWLTENYAIGFCKSNTQLSEAINAVLAELIADGTVQSIIDKYITAE